MQGDTQSGSGSGSGSGSSSAATGSGGFTNTGPSGGGAAAPPDSPAPDNPIFDPDILPPDQSLADRVASNLAQFGPLVSPIGGEVASGGTETVIVPERPSSTNWGKTLLVFGAIGGGIYGVYYLWKHRKGIQK